jgi:hypothetical protein
MTYPYFRDGIQYKSPYFVRHGQFERVASGFCEESADGFVGFKPFYCTEDIVLHHCQCNACDLCGEVDGLASAEVEQSLAVVIGDFSHPTSAVQAVSLKGTQCRASGQQTVPLSIVPPLAEVKTDGRSGKVGINHAVCTFEGCIVFAEPEIMKFPDNLFGCQIPVLSPVSRLANLNHSEQIASDMPAGYQTYKVRIGEEIISAYLEGNLAGADLRDVQNLLNTDDSI